MKVSEMNARQKKAFYNIKYAAYWHIGGLENTLMDNAEDSEIYQEGACCFNSAAASYLKDIRFCGKAWLMERVEARVRKEGY